MAKLQNLLHVFETMINTQMILESNFNEDEENFAMLDDFDDSIIDPLPYNYATSYRG